MIQRKKRSELDSSGMKKNGATIKFGNDTTIIDSEFYQGKPRKYNKRLLRVVDRMSRSMSKTANTCGGGANVKNSMPSFYHPEFEPSSILLPRDYREINAWCRYFYKYDPLVSTAIDSHAELPLSSIRLTLPPSKDKIKTRKIQEEYEEMCSTEGIDLFNKLLQMGVEYYKLGNVFPFARWSEQKNRWTKLTLLDPDYIELEKLQFTDIMRVDLIPNEQMKKIINNGPDNPKTGVLFKAIPEDVIELVQTGKKIPLNTDPNHGSHVAHVTYKMADYDLVGTGIVERNFKTLIYKDRLRQSQDAVASRHLTPKHLIWADSTGMADLNIIREQVDSAFADPDYAIITNYELHWDLVGTSQGLMQLESEWNWINEELLIGLMINKSFLLGEGSYANGQTVLEVMNQKYSIYRERIESYVIQSLFLPMAKRNDWAEYEEGTSKKEKKIKWLYPRIKWNRLNFVDDTAHKQMLAQMVTQGQIDMQTWLECFGLDAETVKERLKRFEGTPLDINYFTMMNGAATEAGRTLAPAIAELRAQELGLKYEPEASTEMFATQNEKITKTAETREQRRYDRQENKKDKKRDDEIEELEVPLEKRLKPERTDQKKVKLFAESENKVEIPDIPFVDTDKAEQLGAAIIVEENSKKAWVDSMIKDLKLSQNARRAVLNLENEILALNGSSTTKIRIHTLKKYLPQVFASRIKDELPITEKVNAAKDLYADNISKLTFLLESKLNETHEIEKIKSAIRETIREEFKV
ncbi:MAG: hypothetical protein PHF86_06620 [Candidatus Nanoarchaeia archaeon]|jgi:hypothetical protein|nr:hypothetical protein [Candidatus Nanoarchaeia archaeon]